jgi:thiol-disulfide isomerase/thioredoxin
MSKKLIGGLIVLVVLAIGVYFTVFTGGELEPEMQQAKVAQTEQQPVASTVTSTPGEYKEYDERAVNAMDGTRLLFFHAPWCPQCRELDTSIKVGPIPENTTIFKVDYDSNQALRKKYGVTIQTTIVQVDGNGEFIKKHVAYDAPTLESVLKNF